MRDLIGQIFALAEGRYRIVDVQQLGRDALVYAEPLGAADPDAALESPPSRPARAALHYEDVAPLLETAAGT